MDAQHQGTYPAARPVKYLGRPVGTEALHVPVGQRHTMAGLRRCLQGTLQRKNGCPCQADTADGIAAHIEIRAQPKRLEHRGALGGELLLPIPQRGAGVPARHPLRTHRTAGLAQTHRRTRGGTDIKRKHTGERHRQERHRQRHCECGHHRAGKEYHLPHGRQTL